MASEDVHLREAYARVGHMNLEPWAPEALEFYRKRGLSQSTVHRFGLGRVPPGTKYKGLYVGGRLAIPVEDGMYRVRSYRFRALDEREPKVLGNESLHLFAVRACDEETAVITEGEINAMSAWQAGVKAVGLMGATAGWKPEWAYLFRNCAEVVLVFDDDTAGDKGWQKCWNSLRRIGLEVRRAVLPQGRDLNDLLVAEGPAAIREVLNV